MVMFQNVRKRRQRRGFPIMGYVGANGGGKTAAMVWDTLPTLAAGRPVLSTVRLLDWENPRLCDDETCGHMDHEFGVAVNHMAAHPGYVRFDAWDQLLDFRRGDVLMDEVTGVASSRESHSMPAIVANLLVQMRRADIVIRWSAPKWSRADKIIRECSLGATHCRGFFPVRIDGEDGEERAWRARRMFSWRTYDAADFDDFSDGKREAVDNVLADWHWGPKSPVFQAYDTFDAVSVIGTVSETGTCYRCGGTRARPKCSCEPAKSRGPRRGGASPEVGPPQGVPRHSIRGNEVTALLALSELGAAQEQPTIYDELAEQNG